MTREPRQKSPSEDGDSPLRQTQKLVSFGLLAGTIAHDLNNFLTSVLGHTELARLTRHDPERLEHHLAQIESGASQAAELVRRLRLCSSNGHSDRQVFHLSLVVEEMLDLLRTTVTRDARLLYDLDPDLPQLTGDVTRLRQVIMNLILNASEALAEGGGKVRVSTGSTALERPGPATVGPARDFKPGRYVYLEIEDDGCGMDEKTRVRVFEPFFTTKEGGSGLGLAALQGFVRQHQGWIELTTAPGKGTTFRVLLPVAAPSRADSSGFGNPEGRR